MPAPSTYIYTASAMEKPSSSRRRLSGTGIYTSWVGVIRHQGWGCSTQPETGHVTDVGGHTLLPYHFGIRHQSKEEKRKYTKRRLQKIARWISWNKNLLECHLLPRGVFWQFLRVPTCRTAGQHVDHSGYATSPDYPIGRFSWSSKHFYSE